MRRNSQTVSQGLSLAHLLMPPTKFTNWAGPVWFSSSLSEPLITVRWIKAKLRLQHVWSVTGKSTSPPTLLTQHKWFHLHPCSPWSGLERTKNYVEDTEGTERENKHANPGKKQWWEWQCGLCQSLMDRLAPATLCLLSPTDHPEGTSPSELYPRRLAL